MRDSAVRARQVSFRRRIFFFPSFPISETEKRSDIAASLRSKRRGSTSNAYFFSSHTCKSSVSLRRRNEKPVAYIYMYIFFCSRKENTTEPLAIVAQQLLQNTLRITDKIKIFNNFMSNQSWRFRGGLQPTRHPPLPRCTPLRETAGIRFSAPHRVKKQNGSRRAACPRHVTTGKKRVRKLRKILRSVNAR